MNNMAVLHNRVSQAELKQRLMAETEKRVTVSFYQYFPIPDPQAFRDQLYQQLEPLRVFGRIYVAQEGINAQVSLPTDNLDRFRAALDAREAFAKVPWKIAVEDDGKSFLKLAIKVKRKIVADGLADDAFDVTVKIAASRRDMPRRLEHIL